MRKELVSIVIPTHNRSALLLAAVESARAAGSDVEVVVVDDGSTDDTPSVCAGLKNITVVRHPMNKGLAAARNTGIKAASGGIVALLDDDDARLPGSLDAQLARFRGMPDAALVYGRIKCKQTGEQWPSTCPEGDVFFRLLESNFIPVTSVLVRREVLLKAGGFDENLRVVEDWDLWLRLASGHVFAALDEPVAVYSFSSPGSGQLSSDKVRMSLTCARVQKKALATSRAASESLSVRRRIRTRFLRRNWFELTLAAIELLLANDRRQSGRHLMTAFQLQPGFSLRNARFRKLLKHLFTSGKSVDIKSVRKEIYADLRIFETENFDLA